MAETGAKTAGTGNASISKSGIEPLVAVVLSGCFIPGLGQMLLGQVPKGLLVFVISVILALVTGGATILLTWPLAAIDAFRIAKKIRAGHTVGTWEWF